MSTCAGGVAVDGIGSGAADAVEAVHTERVRAVWSDSIGVEHSANLQFVARVDVDADGEVLQRRCVGGAGDEAGVTPCELQV
jgi:hypothetical protein